MAALADVGSVARALLAQAGQTARHVWLDSTYGLVVGKFPDASHRFDFASEKFVPLALGSNQNASSSREAKPRISLLSKAGRVRAVSRIETSDIVYEVGSATQMLVEGLNIVERLRPGTVAKLSLEKGRTKRPVAETRDELYDVPHPPEHSARLENGYYVATNNKAHEAIGFLRRAIQIANLEREVILHTAIG